MRASPILGFVVACACGLGPGVVPGLNAATLERLSLEDMSQKSTIIVRAVVQGPGMSAQHSRVIFSHYQLQVTEVWKGSVGASVDVAVPGGTWNGLRESYAGAPVFNLGKEYVFFLWTSKHGVTQIIGLSQGLFRVDSGGQAFRPATTEMLLDHNGKPVTGTDMTMPLASLRSQVQAILGGAGK
jgi:hypothetical protein